MSKTDAVLDVLPSVYGATDRGKLLVDGVRALAHPLEAADGELFRIQQAHRLPVDGLGTPQAVVAAAALFLAAGVVPDAPGDPLLRPLDGDGYSYRATIEFGLAPGQP